MKMKCDWIDDSSVSLFGHKLVIIAGYLDDNRVIFFLPQWTQRIIKVHKDKHAEPGYVFVTFVIS